MQFPTTLYNHIDVPVHENSDTLILWLTPEVRANLDVNTLSTVFQLDKAEIQYRIITIPEFPIPNVYAALTSEDFIYCRDFMSGLEPPFYNPGNRTMKYYYWQNELLGVNPCANCVLFTTDANTAIPTITMTPSGMIFDPDSGNIEQGGTLQTHIFLQGALSSTSADGTGVIGIEPDAATYEISAEFDGEAVPLNSRTYVDSYGILHAQKTLEVGTVITVTATSAYINPSGTTTEYTASFEATVIEPQVIGD